MALNWAVTSKYWINRSGHSRPLGKDGVLFPAAILVSGNEPSEFEDIARLVAQEVFDEGRDRGQLFQTANEELLDHSANNHDE